MRGPGPPVYRRDVPATEIRPPLLSRVPCRAWVLLDGLWALGVGLSYVALVTYHGTGWVGVVSALAMTLPLAVRRIWPRSVFCLVAACALWMQALIPTGAELLAQPVALYMVGRSVGGRWAGGALATALAVAGIALLRPPVDRTMVMQALLAGGVLVAFWAAGLMMRERGIYIERLAAHAEERVRTGMAEERLRIARELHDIVGHSLSTIAVQAGVAAHVGRPEVMSGALCSIGETTRSALQETRRVLGVLREDGEASLAPAPTLSDLPELVERTRAAGIQVTLSVTGDVPHALGLTVYRIVQEALTNVIKHAGAGHSCVTVAQEADGTRVEVVDDGPGGTPGASGHGLAGLRERVRMFGGVFEAGPRPLHGFRVYALLPPQDATGRPDRTGSRMTPGHAAPAERR
ncbi:histidine kinase [Planomonospora alba]|uniref:histidine kinase n=1 Tax=Planomonospora alba TaxID=161354 RepID=A0ABP6MLP3_9ACTN